MYPDGLAIAPIFDYRGLAMSTADKLNLKQGWYCMRALSMISIRFGLLCLTIVLGGFAFGEFVHAQTASDTAQAAAPSIAAEIQVGTGVENRDIVGAADSFASSVGKVFCWSRITGASGASVKHLWFRNGTEMASVDLNVGGSPWRTWSSKTIPASWTGDWEVRVVDSNGTTIASKTFKVE
jgi:Protein of unknown function (DUF2914)